MKDYDPKMSFGEYEAASYPDDARGDEADSVAFLHRLAGGGSALELAVGTGRIARPLAARGVRVSGVDFSQPMLDALREKPGGADISATLGNFADVPVSGEFRLIFIVFNTFFNLLTQESQIRCFENVAKHLTGEGAFVIEAFSPSFLYRLEEDQHVRAESVEVDSVTLDVLRHNPATQTLDENHVSLSGDGMRFAPISQRYAWPAELDLMARIAGLRLKERYDGWNGEPYTGNGNVVSVYGR